MAYILSVEEQRQMFHTIQEALIALEEMGEITDPDGAAAQQVKKKHTNELQGIFIGSHFTIKLRDPESFSFEIDPPNPFSSDYLWEEWVSPFLHILESEWEYSYFNGIKEFGTDPEKQIEQHVLLFETLLALGSKPEPESWGYEAWASTQEQVEGVPQVVVAQKFFDYLHERYTLRFAEEKAGKIKSYFEPYEVIGYSPWPNKEDIYTRLQDISRRTLVLDMREPEVARILTKGTLADMSTLQQTLQEQKKLNDNIQSHISLENTKTPNKI